MIYLLDACAVIAFINSEPEGFLVKEILDRTETDEIKIYMSIINLVEVYYNLIRADGLDIADEIMRELKNLPITVISTVDEKVYREAARFKACYSMSFADVFLCATAKSLAATIITKDEEIRPVEEKEKISIYWINKK